jgi:hypothetical protein
MAYQHLKLKIPKKYDRRIKLTDKERQEIKDLYGKVSQRKLARMFGVSRRLIQFIGCPEKHRKNLLRRADSGGSAQYYNKDKWREQMKDHRRYKQELFLKGKLVKVKK